MLKRLVSLMLVLMLLVTGLLVGCKKDAATTEESNKVTKGNTDEKMKISIAHWEVNPEFLNEDDPIYKIVADKFNVEFEPVVITWDDFNDKISMWAAGDQLPDMFSTDQITTNNFRNWVSNGVIKAIPDVTKYENINKIFEANKDIEKTAVDGKYYMVPRINGIDANEYTWGKSRVIYYRKDWAEAAGATLPTTNEELIEFIKKIQASKPEGKDPVGLVAYDVDFMSNVISLGFEPGVTLPQWMKNKEGLYEPLFFQEPALEQLKMMRAMYKESVMDSDFALVKTVEGLDKFAQGKAVAAAFQLTNALDFINYFSQKYESTYPGKKATDAIGVLAPMKNTLDGKQSIFTSRSFWSETYISANVSDEKADRIMQILDFFASEEFKMLARYGIEGVDYKMENNEIVITREKDENGVYVALDSKYKFLSGYKFLMAWDMFVIPAQDDPAISDDIKALLADMEQKISTNTTVPDVRYDIDYLSSPLKDAFVFGIRDDVTKIIMSDDPVEDIYNEIVQGYKDKGYDAMIKEFNEVLNK